MDGLKVSDKHINTLSDLMSIRDADPCTSLFAITEYSTAVILMRTILFDRS
jgi:hypothetical protein